jgi:hypothetical protein
MISSPVTVFNLKSLGGPFALPSRYSRTAGPEFDKSPKKKFLPRDHPAESVKLNSGGNV